jgi:hypothetical protein
VLVRKVVLIFRVIGADTAGNQRADAEVSESLHGQCRLDDCAAAGKQLGGSGFAAPCCVWTRGVMFLSAVCSPGRAFDESSSLELH